MKLTPEQLTELEAFSGLHFHLEEIAIVLGVRYDSLLAAYRHQDGEVYKAVKRGQLKTEMELRASIRKSAINGSNPAQMAYLGIIERFELENKMNS